MANGESGAWISETGVLDGEVFLGSGLKTVEKTLVVWGIL